MPKVKENIKRDEVSFKSPKICRKKLIMVLIYAFVGEKYPDFPKLPNSYPFLFVICSYGTVFAGYAAHTEKCAIPRF